MKGGALWTYRVGFERWPALLGERTEAPGLRLLLWFLCSGNRLPHFWLCRMWVGVANTEGFHQLLTGYIFQSPVGYPGCVRGPRCLTEFFLGRWASLSLEVETAGIFWMKDERSMCWRYMFRDVAGDGGRRPEAADNLPHLEGVPAWKLPKASTTHIPHRLHIVDIPQGEAHFSTNRCF